MASYRTGRTITMVSLFGALVLIGLGVAQGRRQVAHG
jgi:hypothetical protein